MCLYIGDIGDDYKDKDKLTIYKIKEPYVDCDRPTHLTKHTADWFQLDLSYPNGEKHDSNAMVIDPTRHEIVIFTKALNRLC